MDQKHIKVWYDPEGDFLEVVWEHRQGFFRETGDDRVMEKVDVNGDLLGFSILGVRSIKQKPLDVALPTKA